jgi:hypothetical protein
VSTDELRAIAVASLGEVPKGDDSGEGAQNGHGLLIGRGEAGLFGP